MSDGTANVFIIESLTFDDEKAERFEGRMLSQILSLNDKKSQYYYIRTKKELDEVLQIYYESEYRYLHISSHGNGNGLSLTLDFIPFKELASILEPYISNRRLFISACEMVSVDLVNEIMPKTNCLSVVGPNTDINFNDAAILWSSFYHLMFKTNPNVMKRETMIRQLQNVSTLFNVSLNYYSRNKSPKSYHVRSFPECPKKQR